MPKMQQSDKDWMVPIQVMLGSLNNAEVQACSISSIPDELSSHLPKTANVFKPKEVSIGPLHRLTTRHLQLMEETKWHYMRRFLERNGSPEQTRRSEDRLKDCGPDILILHKVINASYGGYIESEPHELAKIMIVDGCFILEFLLTLGIYTEESEKRRIVSFSDDPIFEDEKKVLSVLNDIIMLENQIPFIVLKKLYGKVFPPPVGTKIEDDDQVAMLVRKTFGYPIVDNAIGAHILNLMHLSTTVQYAGVGRERAKQELKRCATKLRAAGITVQAETTYQRKFEDSFNFNIKFRDGVLTIPQLHIKGTTEVKWRNLIAWEQSKISVCCMYTSYALFFKGLICCKHDIKLLEEMKVLVNESNKKNDDLLLLFSTISKGTEHMDSSYSELFAALNMYRSRKRKVIIVLRGLPIMTWHKCVHVFEIILYYCGNWYTILIREHIPTVWKFIGVLAAIVLLILAIMQTYYTAKSSG